MKTAYLHFGFGDEPRLTIEVPAKEKILDWQAAGLTWTATGYGPRIATHYMVQWEGRWRRVYAAVWGNSPSLYIGPSDAWLATVSKGES